MPQEPEPPANPGPVNPTTPDPGNVDQPPTRPGGVNPTTPAGDNGDATVNVRWGDLRDGLPSARYVFVSGDNWPAGARIEIQCANAAQGIFADTNANIPVVYRDYFADGDGSFSITPANPGVCFSSGPAEIRVWAPGTGVDFNVQLGPP